MCPFDVLVACPKLSKSICQSMHTMGSRACGGRVGCSRGCKCRESLFNGYVFLMYVEINTVNTAYLG